jgi:hypothetical protein
MSDDIDTVERPEWPALPPERELPPQLRTRTLHRAVDSRRTSTRGRILVPLTAAACAGLLVGGFLAADRLGPSGDDDPDKVTTPPTFPTVGPEDDFDLGPLAGAELDRALERCLVDEDVDGSGSEVHYARTVNAPVESADGKPSPAVVFTTRGGRSFVCVLPGLYDARQSGLTPPSGPRDVVLGLDYDLGTAPDRRWIGMRHWLYGVGSDVAYLRLRLVVDGEPGPWKVARPHDDGYLYAGLRYVAPVAPPGQEFVGVEVQTEVYDGDGQRIEDPDVPASQEFLPPGI